VTPENGHLSSTAGAGALPVFPFFLGCARSGTTLFRAIFTSHPDLAIPDETRYFSAMVNKRREYEKVTGFDSERFVDDIFRHPAPPNWVKAEEVRGALASGPPPSYADAVRRVYGLYAAKSGKTRYADKTPLNALMIEPLAESFPESRFVHIIRDGRDVALSLMDRRFGQGHIMEAARYWRRRVTRGRAAGRRIGPGRYREVRYEGLLEDPERTVRELCEFIELPFEAVMLRYYDREQVFDPRPGAARNPSEKFHLPPTKGLRDWRTQLSKGTLVQFEVAAGDLLDELGYGRGVERIPLWTTIGARIRGTGIDARLAARRLRRKIEA
jgi:hypothetical protein